VLAKGPSPLLSAWEFDRLQKRNQADLFPDLQVIWLLFPKILEPGIGPALQE
jgi:hypothetical protein